MVWNIRLEARSMKRGDHCQDSPGCLKALCHADVSLEASAKVSGTFVRLRQHLVWNRLPASLRSSPFVRRYGYHLQSVIQLRERTQATGTFFFRNRPELELLAAPAEPTSSRLEGRHCNSRMQQRGGSLFIFILHPNQAAGSEIAHLRLGYLQGDAGVWRSRRLFDGGGNRAVRRSTLPVNLRAYVAGGNGGFVRARWGASAGQTTIPRRD